MAFSDEVKSQAWKRAGGKCECARANHQHFLRRCNAPLLAHQWHAHHVVSELAGGPDTLANCEALCEPCHKNTASYGRC